jgi:putative heme-binding domain-containing protein
VPRKGRMHALWALVGSGELDTAFHQKLLAHADPGYRAWAVRAAGNAGKVATDICDKVTALAKDKSRDVQLQVAVAARKLEGVQPIPVLVEVLANCGDDRLIPAIVWQNLSPLVEERTRELLLVVRKRGKTPNLGQIMPYVVDRILAARTPNLHAVIDLFDLVRSGENENVEAARLLLERVTKKLQNGEINRSTFREIEKDLLDRAIIEIKKPNSPIKDESALMGALRFNPTALQMTRKMLADPRRPEKVRLRALEALAAVRDESVLTSAAELLAQRKDLSAAFRGQVLATLGRLEDSKVATIVLDEYPKMEPELAPRAVELLTQRANWSKALMKAIADKKLPASVVNVNQARRLLASKDAELVKLTKMHWGTLRQERNPERERVVNQMRDVLSRTKGDATRGIAVFTKLCAQCHKMHGEGVEVGPDITNNGRSSFDQLLSNVFDPSLVIGPGYQAVNVVTFKGRTLTGLLVEDSPMRVVLKIQGGKQEVVARKDIESVDVSKLSLMPEDVEKQLKPQEIADLFAFLVLDRHPSDPKARRIPGTPKGL